MIKAGGKIKDYVLITDTTTAGGGQCEWAFARRGDREYFLKRFLKPTHPQPGAPGSEATKQRRLAECERFERHHLSVQKTLQGLARDGSNLIVATDFFLHGAHYYKVTARVNTHGADVTTLPLEQRLTIMISAANSLEILHRHNLVHGDIKPPNILINEGGDAAKLIDFDNCFEQGNAPDEVVGDPAYYSPEMVEVIVDDAPTDRLTTKSDIFALGVTFVEYLTGSKPTFAGEQRYVGEAVRAGNSLRVATLGPGATKLGLLLESMLAKDSADRPDCTTIKIQLASVRSDVRKGITDGTPSGSTGASDGPAVTPPRSASAGYTGETRGTLLDQVKTRAEHPEAAGSATTGATGVAKGKLLDRARAVTGSATVHEAAASDTPAGPEEPTVPRARGGLLDRFRRRSEHGSSKEHEDE